MRKPPYLPPYVRYSTRHLLLLLILLLLLTGICVLICLNPKYGGDFGSSRIGTSKWSTLVMAIIMDFIVYKNWRRSTTLKKAQGQKEENIQPVELCDERKRSNACVEGNDRKRRVVIAAAILAGSLIIAAAQLLYPGGPTQGWQFSVASAVTTAVFLLAELIFGREE